MTIENDRVQMSLWFCFFFPRGEFHADDKAEYANHRIHVCPEAKYQSDA